MEEEKLKQNEERIWIYCFHSLGLSPEEALKIFKRIEFKINIKKMGGK